MIAEHGTVDLVAPLGEARLLQVLHPRRERDVATSAPHTSSATTTPTCAPRRSRVGRCTVASRRSRRDQQHRQHVDEVAVGDEADRERRDRSDRPRPPSARAATHAVGDGSARRRRSTAAITRSVAVAVSDDDGVVASSGYEPYCGAGGPKRTIGRSRSKRIVSGRRYCASVVGRKRMLKKLPSLPANHAARPGFCSVSSCRSAGRSNGDPNFAMFTATCAIAAATHPPITTSPLAARRVAVSRSVHAARRRRRRVRARCRSARASASRRRLPPR